MLDTIQIRPITPDEWLPDRCLNGSEPFDPKAHVPASGCPSLNYFRENNRETFEQIYESAIKTYGGCGFVAWDRDKVVAYHNFFPMEMARQIKFYGYGPDMEQAETTLIHNCLTIVKGDYARKGICSLLVKASVDWGRTNGWKRFEVHLVLADCEKAWQSDQKSCLTFWERLGFSVFKEYEADKETEQYYGVTKSYSMYLQIDKGE